jgi:hypothetical protein
VQPANRLNFEVIDDDMAAVWRTKSGAERLRIANQMFLFARRTLMTAIRAEHPEWDDAGVKREAARRLLRGSL